MWNYHLSFCLVRIIFSNFRIQLSLLFSHSRPTLWDPWSAGRQHFLPFTISQTLFKLMSTELVMPSNHLILLSPSPPVFNLSQNLGLLTIYKIKPFIKPSNFFLNTQKKYKQYTSHANSFTQIFSVVLLVVKN